MNSKQCMDAVIFLTVTLHVAAFLLCCVATGLQEEVALVPLQDGVSAHLSVLHLFPLSPTALPVVVSNDTGSKSS